jgi:hypothetical protein
MSGIWAALGVAAGTWLLHTRLRALRQSHPANGDVLNRGIFWCLFAAIQTIIPFVTFSRDIEEFLHKPVVEGEPASTPLRGNGKTAFLALAFFGLLISGALLHSLTRLIGL